MAIEMNKSDIDIIVNDILANFEKKPFWNNTDDVKSVIADLLCSRRWRNKIEAFEYVSYILDVTALTLRRFGEMDKWFWETELRKDFKESENCLDNETSDKYKMLNSYFPFDEKIKECQTLLSKLNDLVILNKHTDCDHSIEIITMGRELYTTLSLAFKSFNKEGTYYMSYKDMLVVYRTLTMNALNSIISLENMGSLSETNKSVFEDRITVSGAVVLKSADAIADAQSEQKSDSTPTITEESKQEETVKEEIVTEPVTKTIEMPEIESDETETDISTVETENPVNEPSGESEQISDEISVEETVEETVATENNTNETNDTVSDDPFDNYLEPIEYTPETSTQSIDSDDDLNKRISPEFIDKTDEIQGVEPVRDTSFQGQKKKKEEVNTNPYDYGMDIHLDSHNEEPSPESKIDIDIVNRLIEGTNFELKEFVEEFQKIMTLYFIAKRRNDKVEMAYFCDRLESMFDSFDVQYVITENKKDDRGLKPDMEEWNITKKNIETFEKKADMKRKKKGDNFPRYNNGY